MFSTIQDQQSRELSQKHTARRAKRLKLREEELKLPGVLSLASCQARHPGPLNRRVSGAWTWSITGAGPSFSQRLPPCVCGATFAPTTLSWQMRGR